jgi:hypothetical protein
LAVFSQQLSMIPSSLLPSLSLSRFGLAFVEIFQNKKMNLKNEFFEVRSDGWMAARRSDKKNPTIIRFASILFFIIIYSPRSKKKQKAKYEARIQITFAISIVQ